MFENTAAAQACDDSSPCPLVEVVAVHALEHSDPQLRVADGGAAGAGAAAHWRR